MKGWKLIMFERNYDAVEFGKRLKATRKNAGVTQEQLAEKLILTSESVSRIENGKGMCMPEHIVHICEILNITSDYLYFGSSGKKNKKNDSLSNIKEMLQECDLDEIKRVEQMISLFLRK